MNYCVRDVLSLQWNLHKMENISDGNQTEKKNKIINSSKKIIKRWTHFFS